MVQAASGVMALVGNDAATREQRALKIGLSIADLIAAGIATSATPWFSNIANPRLVPYVGRMGLSPIEVDNRVRTRSV